MRDKEFIQKVTKESLDLEKFFRNHLRKVVKQGNKEQLIKQLVGITLAKAFQNSRKPQYAKYPIRALVLIKARNVLAEFIKSPRKGIETEPIFELANLPSSDLNALQLMEWEDTVRRIRNLDERAWQVLERQQQGYSNAEIAIQIGISEENLRQIICRLKAKLRQLIKEQGYF